jgi:hypothetical protein
LPAGIRSQAMVQTAQRRVASVYDGKMKARTYFRF